MASTSVGSGAGSRAREVGDLLRARRASLRPADVGLPPGTRRRTGGLRREEVAALAAISPTYYTFLEQGRGARPSVGVLDALAGALRLDRVERAYLHQLVHGASPAGPTDATVGDDVVALVDRLDPCPTYVTGPRWDVLASNRAARALWTDWTARPPEDRNLLAWMLCDPAAREVFVEWRAEAAAQLARFRSAAARHPGDPGFAALVDRLLTGSAEMRAWWPRHEVAPLASGVKRLRHPALGEVVLHHTVLQVADAPELKLVTFAPSPADEPRLARLVGMS